MLGRKMYNAMLQSTQTQMKELRRAQLPLNAGTAFTARLTDLVESVTANKSNAIDLVKTYLREMRTMEVDWRAPDANSEIVWKSMGMLSEVDLLKRDGAYWVAWRYPPTLFAAISEMRVYTQINLSVIAQLNSYAAIALYEICARYKHNPTGHTAKQSPDWWVDALTGSEPKIDKATGLPMPRREWRKFKEASLPNALNEINQLSDIEIKLVEIKTGKSVTEIQFQVTLKKVDKSSTPERNISKALLEQAAKSDIPLSTISAFLSKGLTDEVVMFGLKKLEKRANATHLATLDNKTAYLRAVMFDADDRVKLDETTTGSSQSQVTPAEKPILGWEETRRSEVKREFLTLGKEQQRLFVVAAVTKMKASKLFTASIQRKVEEENWTSGVILHASIDAYAEATYGADWMNDLVAL